MPITMQHPEPGIAVVTVNAPPVNALTVQGWFDLADRVTAAGRDPATHVVVLRAEGAGSAPASISRRSSVTKGSTP
jgi:enoyl-CoA hydratase